MDVQDIARAKGLDELIQHKPLATQAESATHTASNCADQLCDV